jgi:hypothetical protein
LPAKVDHARFELCQNRKSEKRILAEVKELAQWLNDVKPLLVKDSGIKMEKQIKAK